MVLSSPSWMINVREMVAQLPIFTFPQHGKHRETLGRFYRPADHPRSRASSRLIWRTCLTITILFCLVTLLRHKSPWPTFFYRSIWPLTGSTDWSQYAYTQYVTTEHYLCNSVMIFESLARYNSKADRLLMYPENWATDTELHATTWDLLSKAKEEYGVKLQPVTLQTLAGEPTWADSLTKLLAFNQTQYKRVLSLDSDSTILKPMDELFLLPPTTLAAPRAYWLPNQKDHILSSQLLLIQPSAVEFNRILNAFDTRLEADYDMEIINHLYNSSALVLPHRPYNMLSGEFKRQGQDSSLSSSIPGTSLAHKVDHAAYLGSSSEIWDPDLIINEAKYVHFSDWPLPKPWIIADEETVENVMPQCVVLDTRKSVLEGVGDEVVEDCRDREIWLGLYADFKRRRQEVCGLGLLGEGDEY